MPERRSQTMDRRTGDHDTIIEIKTKLDRLISDVADIKTNTTQRVETLETHIAILQGQVSQNSSRGTDHEARIRINEMWIRYGISGVFLINALILIYLSWKK